MSSRVNGGYAHAARLPFDLVIFDCDGVLVDSEVISNRVLAEAVTALGLPMSLEETIATFMGLSMEACVAIIEARTGRPVPSGWVDAFRARTFAAFHRELHPIEGVEAALDRISLPTCIASSGPPEKIRITLSVTGLLPRFDGRIFSATEVPRGKPHPDLFLHAAARMGAAPARCAVVEDTLFGVQAGVAAGMSVFGYATLTDASALTTAGARAFDTMAELPRLLAEQR
jgi:HAD superfamily hydrolase (TIGR01509 family)